MRLYMGGRYRAEFQAMKVALDANRERGAAAMEEAMGKVAEAGSEAGISIAAARKPPPAIAPGRIRRLLERGASAPKGGAAAKRNWRDLYDEAKRTDSDEHCRDLLVLAVAEFHREKGADPS